MNPVLTQHGNNTHMRSTDHTRTGSFAATTLSPDPPNKPEKPVREPSPAPPPVKEPTPDHPAPKPVPGTPSITPQEVPAHPGQPLQPGTQHPADPTPSQPSGRLQLVIVH
jgi:outer membrane biosynthesis protein TonB